MHDSLSHWLSVREPADFAARSEVLTRAVVEALPADRPVCALDLGTGTGSNIRYLAERLPRSQRWLAVDQSADLLAELPGRISSWGAARGCEARTGDGRCILRGARLDCEIEARQKDLSALDDGEIFAGRQIVTASALLDLMSEAWLRTTAARCRAENALALFAITYNGRFACTPMDAEDEEVRDLMNRHQKRDRGSGDRAAGPDAGACAERCFVDVGYRVRREPSDWTLGPADVDVQRLLIAGWAEAATEIAPDHASAIANWRVRRLAHLSAGRSRIVVGHDDLAAWP
jgi:hypothetical protein